MRDGRDECVDLGRVASVIRAMRVLNGAVLRALASDDVDAALGAARALSRLLDDPSLTHLDVPPGDCYCFGMRSEQPPPISTTELSERAAELVKRVHETGDAVIVVQDGEPAAVLVDASEFAALREHRRFLQAVRAGLADVEAGRVLTTPEIKKSLEAEFGPIAWR